MSEINVLSLSYGKDSLATIAACEQLGIPIHRIIHAEVWATDDISADLPPMVEFKKKADAIIKERWGLEVEHVCAMTTPDKKYGLFQGAPLMGGASRHSNPCSTPNSEKESLLGQSRGSQWSRRDGADILNRKVKLTYEDIFYRPIKNPRKRERERRYGFPVLHGQWCTGELKGGALRIPPETNTVVSLLGIAADEPERIERHMKKPNVRLPLVEIGWTEADCRKWCEENDLLSPIYTTATRGGCWFCHNQGVGQLRLLRKNYPDLWALLMKWDLDSPVTFRPDGHTVHDLDERFRLEEEKVVPMDGTFKWRMIDDYHAFPSVQMDWDDYFKEIGDASADNRPCEDV